MALYHRWDFKNGSAYVLQFSSLIFDDIGGVNHVIIHSNRLDVLKICKVRKIAYFVQSLKIFLLLGQSEQK